MHVSDDTKLRSCTQLPDVAQPPVQPLPEAGQPAIALQGASYAWQAAAEGGQPTVHDATLQVCRMLS